MKIFNGDWNLWIERAFDGFYATLEYMGVDHSGFDILVPKQLLDSADIVTVLEQVGGLWLMAEGGGERQFLPVLADRPGEDRGPRKRLWAGVWPSR
jgi:hypothetical protein